MVASRVKLGFQIFLVLLFLLLIFIPWDLFFLNKIQIKNILQTPSFAHLLGTDNLGRDMLVRMSEAIAGAILPLWGGVFAGSFAGVVLGFLALLLYESGIVLKSIINIIRTVCVVLASIPVGIMAFTWAVYYEKAGLLPVILALTLIFSIRSFLQIFDLYFLDQNLAYWQAHHAMGGHLKDRIFKYGILGRWKWKLIDTLCFHLQAAVTIEASLSFLGFGIQEPQSSFGNILSSHFDIFLKGQWLIPIIVVTFLGLMSYLPVCFSELIKKYYSFGRHTH